GTLDPTFDGDGRVTPDFGFSGQFANSVALQSDGKIVVVGSRTIPGGAGFLVFRLNSDGSFDSTFGSNGFVVTDPADNSNDELFSVLIQPDGNIVGAGVVGHGSSDANFAMVRYLGGIPNHPPVAEAGGPYTVVQGASVVLDASGSTDPDQDPATLTYQWDLDGDGIFGETGAAASRGDEVGIHPTFSADGLVGPSSLTVTLRVTDVAGASSEDTATINVVQAALQDDPCDPGKFDLVVGGTLGNDVINFALGKHDTIQVSLNGTSLGSFAPTGRLVAYGQSGDDHILVSSSITLQAWLYGGKGNDHLEGGSGPNVLLGEDGNDELIGGSNRDILIGGAGADHLVAAGGEDILIAGTTAFDRDVTALCAVLTEWTRTDANYVTRISHLQGTNSGGLNGPYLLTTTTVLDDGAADVLTGKAGLDWFFANIQGAGTLDNITDLGKQELITDL
ncbi:MAG TPA: PKD domain-containing protein, partial [Gemmataceae bacterium]|nr:PKD domain-containing protein [Gemmataceae bacterium]